MTNHNQDILTDEELLQKAEQFLNFKFDSIGINTTIEEGNGLKAIKVEVPPSENMDSVSYCLEACPVCGEIQPVNFEAYKKNMPKEAKGLLKEKREEQAQKYIETGEQPVNDERLKEKIEIAFLNWDNNQCEQRHPPR